MIFQHTIDKVLSGEKTQTRRIVKPGDVRVCVESPFGGWQPVKITGVGKYNQPLIRWEVGKTYAVQGGRKHKASGRIRVTDLRLDDARKIVDADVLAEGFKTSADFLATWCKMHDPKFFFERDEFDPDMFVGVMPDGNPWLWTKDELMAHLWLRPASRYACWALTFELVKDGNP